MRAVLLLGCATACSAATARTCTVYNKGTALTDALTSVYDPDWVGGKTGTTNTGWVNYAGNSATAGECTAPDPAAASGCHRYVIAKYSACAYTTAATLVAGAAAANNAQATTPDFVTTAGTTYGVVDACKTAVTSRMVVEYAPDTTGDTDAEPDRCSGSQLSEFWEVTTVEIDAWLEGWGSGNAAVGNGKKAGGTGLGGTTVPVADFTGAGLAAKTIFIKGAPTTATAYAGVDGAGTATTSAVTSTTSGDDTTVMFTIDNSVAKGTLTHTVIAAVTTFEAEFKALVTSKLYIKDTQIKDYSLTKIAGNRMRALADEAKIQFTICRKAVCTSATSSSTSNATNATSTSDDDDKVACVALDAPVVVKGRGEVPLRDLKFGDDVQDSAAGTYSPFVAWLHRSEDAADFLELRHETGTLSITPGHLLKLDGAFDAARYARAGRTLQTPTGPSTILSVTASRRAGFAAPLTRSGTIVVAGSEISCYHEAPGAWGSADAVHQLANAGFLPLRWGLPVDGATYANALGGINSVISTFVKMTGADLHLYARTLIGGSSFM